MALLHALGFENGSVPADVTSYAGGTWNSTTQKRTGSYSFNSSGSGVWFIIGLAAAKSELYIQFALRTDNPWSTPNLLSWRKGATILGGIKTNSSAKIDAYTGNFASLVASGTRFLPQSVWTVIEVRVKIDDSTGVITVRQNGLEDSTFSGDTKPGSDADIDALCFTPAGAAYQTYLDDVIVNDITGSLNNSWPNSAKVAIIKPSGDGTTTQYTASTGSNYQCVDEVPPSSTDYVYTNTDAQIDSYAMENAPSGASTILGIVHRVNAWKAGTPAVPNLKHLIRIGGSNYVSGNKALGTSMAENRELWEINPNTSAAWTPTNINDLEAGMQSAT